MPPAISLIFQHVATSLPHTATVDRHYAPFGGLCKSNSHIATEKRPHAPKGVAGRKPGGGHAPLRGGGTGLAAAQGGALAKERKLQPVEGEIQRGRVARAAVFHDGLLPGRVGVHA